MATNSTNFKDLMQEVVKLLKSNHNLILTGAPGTGKTYLAKQIANAMGAETEFVQFHPSYDYTDFVEGLRPINDGNGNIGFERKDGVFKAFCKKALKGNSSGVHSNVTNFNQAYNNFILKVNTEINNNGQMVIHSKTNKDVIILGVTPPKDLKIKGGRSRKEDGYTLTYEKIKTLSEQYKDSDALKEADMEEIREANKHSYPAACWAVLNYIYKYFDVGNISPQKKCEERKIEEKPFVFIIDEINRGDISKILGELFFSIDPGYRGETGKVRTQYQNLIDVEDEYYAGFYVPENVYIIGTMNDIDRSVESMDFAMRRRFAWKEITAESQKDMLHGLEKEGVDKKVIEEAKGRMKSINEEIGKKDNEYGLSSAYHIGPAYFLKLNMYKDEGDGGWNSLWENHIEGVLREYLRGNEDIDKLIEDLRNAYDKENGQKDAPAQGNNEGEESKEVTETEG